MESSRTCKHCFCPSVKHSVKLVLCWLGRYYPSGWPAPVVMFLVQTSRVWQRRFLCSLVFVLLYFFFYSFSLLLPSLIPPHAAFYYRPAPELRRRRGWPGEPEVRRRRRPRQLKLVRLQVRRLLPRVRPHPPAVPGLVAAAADGRRGPACGRLEPGGREARHERPHGRHAVCDDVRARLDDGPANELDRRDWVRGRS